MAAGRPVRYTVGQQDFDTGGRALRPRCGAAVPWLHHAGPDAAASCCTSQLQIVHAVAADGDGSTYRMPPPRQLCRVDADAALLRRIGQFSASIIGRPSCCSSSTVRRPSRRLVAFTTAIIRRQFNPHPAGVTQRQGDLSVGRGDKQGCRCRAGRSVPLARQAAQRSERFSTVTLA